MKFKRWLFRDLFFLKGFFIICFFFSLLQLGCNHDSEDISLFEEAPLRIQTLSLTNHRTHQLYKGDWVLRRQRLDLINKEFKRYHPDILFLQEVLRRNDYDNDLKILSCGGLNLHSFSYSNLATYPDTQETESLAVFYRAIKKLPTDKEKNKLWKIGVDSYIMASELQGKNGKISLFNIYISPKQNKNDIFAAIKDHIEGFNKENKICNKRVIIAGNIDTNIEEKSYQDFMNFLSLKDTAASFCNIYSKCYTKTPENSFSKFISKSISYLRNDRILVHKDAIVVSAAVVYNKSEKQNKLFKRKYKFSSLYPSKRFGWEANVSLPKCL